MDATMTYEKPSVTDYTEKEVAEWAIPDVDLPDDCASDDFLAMGACSGDSCKCTSSQAKT